jgi:hypothetical protein
MKRSAPLKPGKGFKRPTWTPKPCKAIEYQPRPRAAAVAVADTRARMVVQVPKAEPLQHEGYMAAVRKLPCYRCGVVGFTQFCHSDEGKGAAIKTDCREGWPGCGPHYEGGVLVNGCHYLVGTQRIYLKELRRKFEDEAARHTRSVIRSRGEWPADLEPWPEDMEATA